MCLEIDIDYHYDGKRSGPLVAKAPILVYKRLKNVDSTGGTAPYMGTRWVFGVKMTAKLDKDKLNNYTIEEGLHAFFNKTGYRVRGYESALYPAVIPAGAKFYLGEDGEIACTELTVYRNDAECLAAFGAKSYGAPVDRDSYVKGR